MNNDFNRFIIIRSINIYHHQISNLIEKFYQKQRDYQLRIDARRYNWFLTCDEERDSFKKEIFKTKLNTIKNIQDFNRPQDPSKISLEFLSLLKSWQDENEKKLSCDNVSNTYLKLLKKVNTINLNNISFVKNIYKLLYVHIKTESKIIEYEII